MKPFQEKLVAAWRDYAAGRIDAKTLKGQSAGFGIYQQRDDATMMRLRRPGGVVTTGDLRAIAALLTTFKAPFCHLTTRLDIQLHGIKAADVPAALEACEAHGFPFRGGGGDTFRNVQVNACSGLHADTAFDVIPYARAFSTAFYSFDTAYGLPRKIKIGFVDRVADRQLATVQDLGFVAKIENGRRVFETWVAGGIGFKPRVGLKIFDALPAEDCARLAFALTRLFDAKGCRTNRAHARIRFLREDLGDAAFVAQLKEAFARETAAPVLSEANLLPEEWPQTKFTVDQTPAPGFAAWKQLAATPLANGTYAVRLFVPYGNMTAAQLVKLCDALELEGVTKMHLLVWGDFAVPNVPENQLPAFYNLLVGSLGDVDYTVKSFKGHILTCVGSSICKIGANDSPAFGTAIAAAFDRDLPADTPEKIAQARLVLNDIRISGCPNCCTNTPLAKFGFLCRKVGDQLAVMPLTGAVAEPSRLGELQRDVIPCADVADWISAHGAAVL